MSNALPYIVQGSNIVVVIDNNSHTISKKTHIAYDKILEAIKASDWSTVRDLIEPKKILLKFGAGNISIQGDKVSYKGLDMHNALTRRMVQMYQEGFSIEPLVKFMDNLMANPSARAVKELYGFLEKNQLPVTPDGCFLAYKKVSKDYTDCHTGKVPNKPAYLLTPEEKAKYPVTVNGVTVAIENDTTVVSMERNMVDDDQNRTCSSGLHFCSSDYLQHFSGEHTMIVKLNPRDVVSIPTDYNDSKGRACRYEVVGELGAEKQETPEAAFTATVHKDGDSF